MEAEDEQERKKPTRRDPAKWNGLHFERRETKKTKKNIYTLSLSLSLSLAFFQAVLGDGFEDRHFSLEEKKKKVENDWRKEEGKNEQTTDWEGIAGAYT